MVATVAVAIAGCYDPDLSGRDGGPGDVLVRSDARADAGQDAAYACGVDPPAPGGDAACPTGCTGGCVDGVCTIDCATRNCMNDSLVCPPNYACVVVCNGADACDTGDVTCPDGYACTLTCGGGPDACGDVLVTCGTGTCLVECEADSCAGMTVMCGSGACTAVCGGTPKPGLSCGEACACTPC
jgi:hypothetical protein